MGFFKLKKFLLLLSFFVLCGCKATYEIEIIDDKVSEEASFIIKKTDIENKNGNLGNLEEEIDYVYNNFHDLDNTQEEEKTRNFNLVKIDDVNNIGLKYNDIFSMNDYSDSPVIRQCYEEVSIINTAKAFYLNTSSNFKCFDYYKYLDEVIIKLKTDYSVSNSNSDKKENNVYYWYINKDNYKNKSININIVKGEIKSDVIDEKVEISDEVLNLIIIIIIVIMLIICLSIYNKVRKSNK